jgi:outer membrane protein insertion porin family
MLLRKKILTGLLLSMLCALANAETFVIKKIRVHGLQRISYSTVISNLSEISIREGEKISVEQGKTLDSSDSSDIIRALYKTNFFSEVSLKRENDDLVITVVERPVIGALFITGNNKITKKQLTEALKHLGISEGQALDQFLLNAIKHGIIQEYYNKGLYSVKVDIDIKPEARNRSTVSIKIYEGPTAKIKSIKITGNRAFTERTLLGEFSLTTTKPWSFFTDSDKYSQEKIYADLEKVRSYYMDRGYLQVKIDQPKVTITPDHKAIYIVINITEGAVYKIGGFDLKGDLLGKKAEIMRLIKLKAGDVFSHQDIVDAISTIKLFLGDLGFGLAEISDEFSVNESKHLVYLKLDVKPGHRVYVRNINFTGNYKTHDDVLRREMRLQEGSVFSLSKINESKRKLNTLGYIQALEHETTAVPDSNNQIDLLYKVKETLSTSIQMQGGYSDRDGIIYGLSASDQNLLGTGKSAHLGFDNSRARQVLSLGYRDPYFTPNKVGLGVNVYRKKIDPHKISAQIVGNRYSTYGSDMHLDVPLSDNTWYGLGLGYEHIIYYPPENPSQVISDFLKYHDRIYNQARVAFDWGYENFDRIPFPTQGFSSAVLGEVYLPLTPKSLEYYRATFDAKFYYPLISGFIFNANLSLGYGDGFGKTKKLFFLKNFFAGGIGTIRGFDADTITNNPNETSQVMGGNLLTVASASLIIPTPISDVVRPRIFIDVGGVDSVSNGSDNFKLDNLRASWGLQVEWITPLGMVPLTFSIAQVIRKKSWDSTSMINFTMAGGW